MPAIRTGLLTAALLLAAMPCPPSRAGGFIALGQSDNIARDGLTFGTQYNDVEPSRAQRMSLAQCRGSEASERARNACKIIGPLIDQCFAVALDSRASPHGTGLALAEERQRAALLAMEECRKTAGPAHRDACAIIADGCDGEANFLGTPRDEKAFRERATAYFNKGDLAHALADYDQAIKLDARDATAYNGRGGTYLRKDDFDRALADFNQAITIDAKYAGAYNNRGTLYKAKHDNDAAIADYSQAISIDPQNVIPLIIVVSPSRASTITTAPLPTTRPRSSSTRKTPSPLPAVASPRKRTRTMCAPSPTTARRWLSIPKIPAHCFFAAWRGCGAVIKTAATPISRQPRR